MSLLHWATPVLICRIACRWTLKWATGMDVSVPGGSTSILWLDHAGESHVDGAGPSRGVAREWVVAR